MPAQHEMPLRIKTIRIKTFRIKTMGASLLLGGLLGFGAGAAHANEALLQLLQERRCQGCRLADVDLVHADLRDADLGEARLMRANLSQAQLDGADLNGADLSFTSLRGASLRGADLRGSKLFGTDLRDADLSGAQLDPDALEQAHWQGAQGIAAGSRSHAALHNAGVEAFLAGNWSSAETLFSDAIRSQPQEPLSWVARGISRSEQAKDDLAAADFNYAAALYQQQGSAAWADQLKAAADAISERRYENNATEEGSGVGSQLLGGAISGLRMIAPLAAKAFMPFGLGL